jgi:hypothetical protein
MEISDHTDAYTRETACSRGCSGKIDGIAQAKADKGR